MLFTFQVPLGIILKSEQKNDEMQDILDDLHQYVPTVTTTEKINPPGYPSVYIPHDHFHHLAFGK